MTTFTVTIDEAGMAHTKPMPDDVLHHLQSEIGGYADVVRLAPGLDLWVDDEALLMNAPGNAVASTIAATFTGATGAPIYRGVAVFTGGADNEGHTLGLGAETARLITTVVDCIRDPRTGFIPTEESDRLRERVGQAS